MPEIPTIVLILVIQSPRAQSAFVFVSRARAPEKKTEKEAK